MAPVLLFMQWIACNYHWYTCKQNENKKLNKRKSLVSKLSLVCMSYMHVFDLHALRLYDSCTANLFWNLWRVHCSVWLSRDKCTAPESDRANRKQIITSERKKHTAIVIKTYNCFMGFLISSISLSLPHCSLRLCCIRVNDVSFIENWNKYFNRKSGQHTHKNRFVETLLCTHARTVKNSFFYNSINKNRTTSECTLLFFLVKEN